jgi:TM2 domain-containing membrane protein YozV
MNEICPHCGKVSNEESPRFCSGCGARMDGSIPAGYPGYPAQPKPQKNPMLALSYSSVLPGRGQVYNGQTAKGFAIFIFTLAGLVILPGIIVLLNFVSVQEVIFLVAALPGIIVWIYGIYDAYTVAGKMNTGAIPFLETRTLHMILFIVFAVAVIIVVLMIITLIVMSSLMAELPSFDTGYLKQISGY